MAAARLQPIMELPEPAIAQQAPDAAAESGPALSPAAAKADPANPAAPATPATAASAAKPSDAQPVPPVPKIKEDQVPASVLVNVLERYAREHAQKTLAQQSAEAAASQPEALPEPSEAKSKTEESTTTTTKRTTTQAGSSSPPGVSEVHKLAGSKPGDEHLEIRMQNADLREVLDLLSDQGNLNILASKAVTGKVTVSLHDVNVKTALDAILTSTGFATRHEGNFLFVGTPMEFDEVEQAFDRVGTRVYRPNYISAKELQTLLTPLLTATTGKISVTTPSEVGIPNDSTKAGGDSYANGEAVVVQDYEGVLAQMDQILKELDRRPMQVAIEAMILSVKLDDAHQFGVNFQVMRDKNNVRFGWGTPQTNPLDGAGSIDPATGGKVGEFQFNTGGLKFAFLDDSLGAFINALETVGDTNVIATPRLMCLNKQRAEILIGSQLGYVSTTVTETSSSQNVEFLEVGAQLRIRPFISTDGIIRMEIHPELSTGQVRIEGGFTLPEKELTQVTTNIMAHDGCTVIIGGLTREDLATTTQQVPFVGSLPVVGALFRNKKESTQRREILVLVTPRIVYDQDTSAEANQLGHEFTHRQDSYADHMSPIGKRYLGRTYFRKAEAAMANGNMPMAKSWIDLSVHCDPLCRPALELQAKLNGDLPPGEIIVEHGAGVPVDGEIKPWMLDDLEAPDWAARPRLHPRDPGQPGYAVELNRPRHLSSKDEVPVETVPHE